MPATQAVYDPIQLRADLQLDEGLATKAYHDSTGIITIGIGRNLENPGLSADEVELLYRNDINRATFGLDHALPWWRGLDPEAQLVMINLTFNMGISKFTGFSQFLSFMQAKRYADAANDLKKTAWYGQVGQRGPRMVARLLKAEADQNVTVLAASETSAKGQT